MRAELDEVDLERIAQIVSNDLQHWLGIALYLILTELETGMSALDDAVARNTTSVEALLSAYQSGLANQTPQGAIDALNAESDKVDAALAAAPPAA